MIAQPGNRSGPTDMIGEAPPERAVRRRMQLSPRAVIHGRQLAHEARSHKLWDCRVVNCTSDWDLPEEEVHGETAHTGGHYVSCDNRKIPVSHTLMPRDTHEGLRLRPGFSANTIQSTVQTYATTNSSHDLSRIFWQAPWK